MEVIERPAFDACVGKNDKYTPKGFPIRLVYPDSGYSSLPHSPIKPIEKISRRSLSLQDTDTPESKRRSFGRRVLYSDHEDEFPSFEFDSNIKRRNSSPDLNQFEPEPVSPEIPCTGRKIDFLKDLEPFPHIITTVFRYLDGASVTSICCVSKTWRRICMTDRLAIGIRSSFLRIANLGKENPIKRVSSTVNIRTGTHSSPLYENQTLPEPPPKQSTPTLFEQFSEAAKNLPSGAHFIKCIKCSSPSQVMPSSPLACCIASSCAYRFCSHCQCHFTDSHRCRVISSSSSSSSTVSFCGGGSSTPTLRMGSEKCKRNLHRLKLT